MLKLCSRLWVGWTRLGSLFSALAGSLLSCSPTIGDTLGRALANARSKGLPNEPILEPIADVINPIHVTFEDLGGTGLKGVL